MTPDQRLVIECGVRDGIRLLSALDRDGDLRGISNLSSASDLHITVFHFGKPKALYEEVRRACGASFDVFWSELSATVFELLTHHERLLQTSGNAQGDVNIHADFLYSCVAHRYRYFIAPERKHLVLMVIPSPELAALRAACEIGLRAFLKRLGVMDPDAFVKNSRAIAAPRDFRWVPHITVASFDYEGSVADLPLPDLPSKVGVALLPPSLHGQPSPPGNDMWASSNLLD